MRPRATRRRGMQTPDSQQLAAEEAWADEIEASRAEAGPSAAVASAAATATSAAVLAAAATATGAADDDDMTMDELRAEALQRKRKPPEQQATSPAPKRPVAIDSPDRLLSQQASQLAINCPVTARSPLDELDTPFALRFALAAEAAAGTAQPERYVPSEMMRHVSPARLAKGSGVQAAVLFKIPFLNAVLKAFGAATPATKAGMFALFRARSDFGILPGGMEEVALYARGRERVYLRRRAGFIKYALQHGYKMTPIYTFGETRTYHTFTGLLRLRLLLLLLKLRLLRVLPLQQPRLLLLQLLLLQTHHVM